MNIDLPEGLVQILESMDRNARAYGWNVATYGKLEDIVPQYAENPFNDPKWRDKLGWTIPYPSEYAPNEELFSDFRFGGVKNGILIVTTGLIERTLAETFVQFFLLNHGDAPDDYILNTFSYTGDEVVRIVLKKDVPHHLEESDVVPSKSESEDPLDLSPPVKSCAKVIDNEAHSAHEWGVFDTKTQRTTSYWCDGFYTIDENFVVDANVAEDSEIEDSTQHKDFAIRDNAGTVLIDIVEPVAEELVVFSATKDDLVQAINTRHIYSCAECPYGTHLDPEEQWQNNPTKAYFSCALGLGPNPERQWSEHAPCENDHKDGYYKRILKVIGLDINTYLKEGNNGPKIDVNDV